MADAPTTLTDEEIVTTHVGGVRPSPPTADVSDPGDDTGDDTGDVTDTTDTGDDAGDDSGDAA
ncbi:MAG: hypothetical protein ACJ77N_12165 [Chloroflexota bacterium]